MRTLSLSQISRAGLWAVAAFFSWTSAASAAPVFTIGSLSQACMGAPTAATSTGTIQISGGGNCNATSVFPTPTAPPGWIAILPGGGVSISGTGSGVFDSSFFPIGFEARDSRGALTGSITINGQVFSGTSLYTADIASALMGQTLSSWSVSIGGGQYQTQGQGMPPMSLSNPFSYCVWLGTNSLCNTGTNNSPTNPLFPTNPGGGSSSSSSSGGGSSSSSGGGGSPEPWVFTQVPSGRWTDPPFVNGFAYTGTGGTLFDKITLPTGYGASFNIYLTGNNLFGTFSAGDVVDFLAGGVSYFEIRGIAPAVDAASPTAFPLQVFFEGGGNGDFTQLGLEAVADVPEPATWVMIALAVPVALWRRRRS